MRREPVEHIHPVVRRHPVTGEEALYVNKQFTRRIVGLKKEESEAILKFIYDHMAGSVDLQARVHWSPNTVVLWDNRVTAHVRCLLAFLHALADNPNRVRSLTTEREWILSGVMALELHLRLSDP